MDWLVSATGWSAPVVKLGIASSLDGGVCKRLTRRTTSATSQAMRPRAALRGTA